MVGIPIACSLTADGAADRLGEWRPFVGQHVAEVRRERGAVHLRLREGTSPLAAAAGLGRREKACCTFLDLRLTLLPDGVWLDVEAPDGAARCWMHCSRPVPDRPIA